MLGSLHIRQFALVEAADLEFAPGMTVFTGETGAGKSILIDALGAAFGARASADWVRHGAEKAEVTAVWEGDVDSVRDLLQAHAIDGDDGLIMRRIVNADGRSRAFVNGVPVPARLLRDIGERLLDLHGQHEHQALLHADFQRRMLDAWVPGALLDDVARAHARWQALQQQLDALDARRRRIGEQAAWMREELARLEALAPEPGLAERLEAAVEQGRRHAQLQQAAAAALALVDEDEPNARALIGRAMRALAPEAGVHEGLAAALELLAQADAVLDEAAPELRAIREAEFDEAEFRADEARLMALHEAMRRHDADEAGLVRLIERWRDELALADTAEWDEARLQDELAQAARAYASAARKLHEARRQAADALAARLRPQLDELALREMQVRFAIDAREAPEHWRPDGFDALRLEIMANPGEPWRPLGTTISGGELSRFVLALKGCDAMQEAPPIAVFDEVDTGVGGETAWHIGRVLAAMGRRRQVLAISHLPQVAACADHHVHIEKVSAGGRTMSRVRTLDESEREREIARMLGGTDAQSLQHARALLRRAAGSA